MSSLHDEIQEVRARYPEGSRSAVLPALRLAQERDGWLSRETLEEVADALEVTPAAAARLARDGYDPAFGARPLKRVIQRELGDEQRHREADAADHADHG